MKVERVTNGEWVRFGYNAHLICFNEKRDTQLDRIDFALLAVDEEPIAYMTCKELDGKTIYLQYGGAFPSAKGTIKSFFGYAAMLRQLKEYNYDTAGTYIENTNKTMLKFAAKAGWIITGIRTHEGSVLLEHRLKFKDLDV